MKFKKKNNFIQLFIGVTLTNERSFKQLKKLKRKILESQISLKKKNPRALN